MSGTKSLLAPLALSCALLASLPAQADRNASYSFDTSGQLLTEALKQYAQTTNQSLIFTENLVQGVRANAVKGNYTAEVALAELLKGTGLVAVKNSAGALQIRKADGAKSSMDSRSAGDIRVVRVGPEVPARAVSAADESANREERVAPSATDTESDLKGVPEVLVKGQRSINTDIRRTEEDPQPYVVFDREQIARSQASNIEEFLKTRLPMNTARQSGTQTTGPGMNVTSSINLRGLGASQTLILVDGRRLPGTTGGVNNPLQADINGIPLASIERIEVLPSTAGGIYGGSATGGVINVILRHDYRAMEAGINYTNTFDTDAGAVRVDLASSFPLGERTQVMLAASRSESNELMRGDRDGFYRRAVDQLMKNNRSAIMDGLFLGAGINIQSAEGNLVLDPQYGGTPLGATVTYLPLGYAGLQSDGGAVLVRNAGSYNLDMAPGLWGRDQGLMTSPEVESVSLNLRHQLAARLEGFVDVSRSSSKGTITYADVPAYAYYLPADAPNNPFQQAINVANPITGYSADFRNESTSTRATGGLIARLPRRWTAALDYGWSRSTQFSIGSRPFGYEASSVVSTGLSGSNGRPAVDILQEDVDLSAYLLPDPVYSRGPYTTQMRDATLRLSGPALAMPGGALNLSFMAERREEKMRDGWSYEPDLVTEIGGTRSFNPHQSQEVTSYYLEATAPLLSAKNARPWARELELQASVRRDEYATNSSGKRLIALPPDAPVPDLAYTTAEQSSDNYTLALRYVPVEGVALRASLGTGFLPPSVTQIVSSAQTVNLNFGTTDPKRGRTSMYVGRPWTMITGGNPELKPETSRSWSAGVVLTPRIVPGLRLSADYTQIDKTNEIQGLAGQYVMDHEDELPGRIVRGERLPGDPPEWAGPVISEDISLINAAKTMVKAYDFRLDYTMQARGHGEFKWYAIATWQPEYKKQRFPGEPIVNGAGYGLTDMVLKWKGNAGVDWTLGPWSLGWNMQYYDSYHPYAGNADPGTRDLFILNQGGDLVPSQAYHDVIGVYRFDGAAGILANSQITVGMQNVFNKMPPATFDYGDISYSGYGNILLRRYSVAFRKSF